MLDNRGDCDGINYNWESSFASCQPLEVTVQGLCFILAGRMIEEELYMLDILIKAVVQTVDIFLAGYLGIDKRTLLDGLV
jgi:hypothetical protein